MKQLKNTKVLKIIFIFTLIVNFVSYSISSSKSATPTPASIGDVFLKFLGYLFPIIIISMILSLIPYIIYGLVSKTKTLNFIFFFTYMFIIVSIVMFLGSLVS